jgi:hypothetical protein
LTALPKTIFDKQLAAFGQLQNKLGSLNPAKSKGIGLNSKWFIQLLAHSEKGAKRVKPLQGALRLFLMGLKAAANQHRRVSGIWSTLAWVIDVTLKIYSARQSDPPSQLGSKLTAFSPNLIDYKIVSYQKPFYF